MRTEAGIMTAATLGALSGLRSMGPSALVAREMAGRPRFWFAKAPAATRWLSRGLQILALGELLADKAPGAPDRTQAPSVAARMIAGGALGAYALRRSRLLGALAGACAALAATHLAFALRTTAGRKGRLPGLLAAVVEDALVLAAGGRLARSIR